MKLAMALIATTLMLTLSSGVALAQTTPPTKGGGQGQGQGQTKTPVQTPTPGANQLLTPTPGQLPTRGQRQGQGQAPDKNQGADRKQGTSEAPGQGRRQGAAGTVQGKGTNGFDLQTNQGLIRVTVDNKTRYQVKGNKKAGFAEIANGDRANVSGTRDSVGNLVARLVHVVPGKPSRGHIVGTVSSVSSSSITVNDHRSGQPKSFAITSSTRIVLPQGQTSVKVGDAVTVVGTGGSTPTATGIVVHQPEQDQAAGKKS